MKQPNASDCLQEAIKALYLEARAEEIEETLDVLCDQISPIDSLELTPIDVEWRKLKIELCDIYQSLALRCRRLIK